MLFGQFVEDWKVETEFFDLKGSVKSKGQGYVHFGWILYGTGLQDVWEGASDRPAHFGTTVRVYDPKADVWNCVWLLGRKVG